MPSPEKPPLLTPKKDKVPVLLSFLPNETALVTDSEDDSDANEALHDAETMPGEAHASMPPSPLSPRRTCASGPNPSPTCIGCEGDYPDCRDDRAALPRHRHPHPTPWMSTTSPLRPHRSRLPVRATPRVPTTGLLTAADLPSSSSFAHTTPHPYPFTAPDTPLHHAGVFFCYLLIF